MQTIRSERTPASAAVLPDGPHTLSRRRFLRLTGLSGAGLAVGLATPGLAAPRRPLRRWSNPRTWGGRVPGPGSVAVVRGRVLLDRNATVAGVVIRPGAELVFQPKRNRTLRSRGNVIVHGRLIMRPAHRARIHRLVFTGVREGRFRGGGMNPIPSDVGLWVRPGGTLRARGAAKLAWTRAAETIPVGATRIRLTQVPAGWRPGDELLLTPTSQGEGQEAFETVRVASVAGTEVVLRSPTTRSHTAVTLPGGAPLGPEVANLTRNVRIEGTPGGYSHTHMKVTNPQVVRYVALRYMGLRETLGRYGLHFHHSMDGTRRTLVDGVVVRDSKGRAFVPHSSHGIRFRRCIAYNIQTGFWWDRMEHDGTFAQTHDTTFVDCLAARGDTQGFLLNFGNRNTVRGSVAVGFFEPRQRGAGYFWPAGAATRGRVTVGEVWVFEDNIAHNNQLGMFVWQNTSEIHPVDRTLTYHNSRAETLHGAYRNPYQYRDSVSIGRVPLDLHASSNMGSSRRDQQQWIRMTFASIGDYAVSIRSHVLAASCPTLLLNCAFLGASVRAIEVDQGRRERGLYDFVGCTAQGRDLSAGDFHVRSIHPETVIRVQRGDGTAFQITAAGVSSIPPFFPSS